MIESFRHKGLKALYEDDNTSGVKQDQVKRLRSFSQTRCQFKTSRHGFSWLKITPATRQFCRISCGDGIRVTGGLFFALMPLAARLMLI